MKFFVVFALPVLRVQDLCISFCHGNKPASNVVDHFSFTIRPRETVAMVGESGSGKTVSALAILKLISQPPASINTGKILFRQADKTFIDLLELGPEKLQNIRGKSISMIFQEPMSSLNPVFTCGDQVAESLRIHLNFTAKDAYYKVLDLFDEVRLPRPAEIFNAYPHELSGGQKQRVMIAMAISCNPTLLIADEPTTALDVTVQKTILELLRQLQERRGMSILFITHDLGLVSGFADRIIVVHKGRIVEMGTVTDIFRHPEDTYTQGLLACRPPLNSRLTRLPTVNDFINGKSVAGQSVIMPDQREKNHQQIYSKKPVLKIEHLGKKFGKHQVLHDACLEVYPGETLGIVGESGSGKTTLARVVLDLIPSSAGRVFFDNTDITKITLKIRKKFRKEFQIIFQDPYASLNPRLTVGEAILEPMKVHGLHGNHSARRDKVVELLEMVGLTRDIYNRYPHEFSGGQRQRICIARALAVEPRLIICDESVSALDVSVQAQVLNLLNDLKRDFGLTYIFISHDLAVVKYMSDRIIVMQNGSIVEMGEADVVFGNPKSAYTRDLLNAIPGKIPANVVRPCF
ncbi:MAG: ABC transporter ATP-binding protein [Alphaproteobacteria bacterium]|nr:ABC transporter ATP-binding protein [Alphaproteobacteria bacterium]